MKRFSRLLMLLCCLPTVLLCQIAVRDTIYLKDGTSVCGIITKQSPDSAVVMQIQDGSVRVIRFDHIARIARGKPEGQGQEQQPTLAEAERLFDDGKIDQSIAVLEKLLTERKLRTVELRRAYELLASNFLAKSFVQQAEDALRKLLVMVPNYSPDPDRYSDAFIRQVDKVRKELERSAIPSESPFSLSGFSVTPMIGGMISLDGEYFLGVGVRLGARFRGGLYAGGALVVHSAGTSYLDLSPTHVGCDIGYEFHPGTTGPTRVSAVRPYASVGALWGSSRAFGYSTCLYVAGGLAVIVQVSDALRLTPDLEYVHLPVKSDGGVEMHVGLTFVW
jgi:hypothetical protein